MSARQLKLLLPVVGWCLKRHGSTEVLTCIAAPERTALLFYKELLAWARLAVSPR